SSTSEGLAQHDFTTPTFGAGTTTAPIPVYESKGRGTPADPLALVLNPRASLAYGADSLTLYVEGYNFPKPTTVPFELRDEQQKVVHRDSLRFTGGKPVETAVVHIAPSDVSLGQVTLAAGTPENQRTSLALVSFAQGWAITSFDEVISMLRYFPNT